MSRMKKKKEKKKKLKTIGYVTYQKISHWINLSAQNVDTGLARRTGKSGEEDLLKQQATKPQNKVEIF